MVDELSGEMSDAEIREQLALRVKRLKDALARAEQALQAFENPTLYHKMGTEARQNISVAQRKRWQNFRLEKERREKEERKKK